MLAQDNFGSEQLVIEGVWAMTKQVGKSAMLEDLLLCSPHAPTPKYAGAWTSQDSSPSRSGSPDNTPYSNVMLTRWSGDGGSPAQAAARPQYLQGEYLHPLQGGQLMQQQVQVQQQTQNLQKQAEHLQQMQNFQAQVPQHVAVQQMQMQQMQLEQSQQMQQKLLQEQEQQLQQQMQALQRQQEQLQQQMQQLSSNAEQQHMQQLMQQPVVQQMPQPAECGISLMPQQYMQQTYSPAVAQAPVNVASEIPTQQMTMPMQLQQPELARTCSSGSDISNPQQVQYLMHLPSAAQPASQPVPEQPTQPASQP